MRKLSAEKNIRIGGGGGFADDRIDAAVTLIERGNIDYLSFDSLSENELSQITMKKLDNPAIPGYDWMLEKRMKQILPAALKHKVKIIGNMGSTNPVAAAEYLKKRSKELGHDIKIAAVTGDNVIEHMRNGHYDTVEGKKKVGDFGDTLVAAHAYVDSYCIEEALRKGADIVLTGRVGDAAMYLGALRYEFNWGREDWGNLAKGIMIGHELECAGHLSGGYFCDPPYKITDNGFDLGFPIVEVHENGDVFFTKVDGTGGQVTVDTCKEQALYEVHDPANYQHAEVTVDLSGVWFEQKGKDRVQMFGVKGKPAPNMLKVAMGVREGYFSTTTVWFAGPGARARAEWARDMLYARFKFLGYKPDAVEIFLMGIDGVYGNAPGVPKNLDPWEVGVRMAARSRNYDELEAMLCETASRMSTNGPAAGTCENKTWSIREVVAYYHTFIPREVPQLEVVFVEE